MCSCILMHRLWTWIWCVGVRVKSWMASGLRIHELPRVQLAHVCCHSNKCRVVTREIYCGSVVLFFTHKPVIHQGMWRDHETHRDSWFAMKHFAQLWCSWMGSRRLIFIVIFLSRWVLNLLLPRKPPRCSSWLEASRTNRNRHTVKQELTVKMKGGVYSGWATLVHYRLLSGEESIYMTVWGASWTERGVWEFISNRFWSKLICNYRRHRR